MTDTNRARVALLVSPIWFLFLLLVTLSVALSAAFWRFGAICEAGVREDCRIWYREVFRVAVYGSTRDNTRSWRRSKNA